MIVKILLSAELDTKDFRIKYIAKASQEITIYQYVINKEDKVDRSNMHTVDSYHIILQGYGKSHEDAIHNMLSIGLSNSVNQIEESNKYRKPIDGFVCLYHIEGSDDDDYITFEKLKTYFLYEIPTLTAIYEENKSNE